jgi:MerR family transcriptional regulator, light-induced transcriptional regulator
MDLNKAPEQGNDNRFFPISRVSEATGVPTVTLRAWERRYNFLKPERTASGHRLYSEEHISLVKRVTSLIDSGMTVSRVDDMLAAESREHNGVSGQDWTATQKQLFDAVCEFDEPRLNQLYENLLTLFSDATITREVVIPLMQRLGTSWSTGETGVAEEHFFSLYIRNKLGSRWHHGHHSRSGSRLVIACMPGEHHEYGLLFFALVARARGFDPVLLGADMPLAELDKVVIKTRAVALVICSTIVPGWQLVERDLKKLCKALTVPVFVGGAGILGMEETLAAVGARSAGHELDRGVERIQTQLAGS